MTTSTHRSKRFWRQLVGCIVAYALVLQGLMFALTGAQAVVAAVTADQQTVELCLHDPSAPGLPDQHGDHKTHCPLCLAAAHQLLIAPDAPVELTLRVAAPAAWSPSPAIVAASVATRAHQARGPPRVV